MDSFGIFRTRTMLGQLGAFALGFVSVSLTLALRVYLSPHVEAASLIFFIPAILLTSSVGGFWAGAFATLLSGAYAAYFLLPPLHSFRIESPFAVMTMSVLILTGLFVAAICEFLRRTILRSEAANGELVEAHKAADQLAAIVEGSSDAIIGKSLDGVITSWNKSSATSFGYSSAEAIGSHISMLIPPNLLAEEQSKLAEIAAGRTVNHFETHRLRKHGTVMDVAVTISPVRDAHGVIVGASTTMRDITEHKRAEKEIQSTRAKLEAALQCMTDAVFIYDADSKSIQVNDAFATQHRFAGVTDCLKTLEDYPDLLEVFSANGRQVPFEDWPISRALRGEAGLTEITLRRKDTGASWVASVNFAPITDPDGAVTGAVLTERDITEQKDNEARLEAMRGDLARAGRMNELGEVSAGLAHELNQPLAAMLNYSNVAKRLIAKGDSASLMKASAAIAKATDQAARAGDIIRRMRAFIERREMGCAIEDINLIVEDAITMGLKGAESTTIYLELASGMPAVFVDRVQIQQVLVNLTQNAVEAMAGAPRRELTVSTSTVDDGGVEVSIKDTGPGIPLELADRLFMPFITNKPSGMGIGLVISQSIVEAHGGRIQVESTPGDGARFHFRLPSATAARAAA